MPMTTVMMVAATTAATMTVTTTMTTATMIKMTTVTTAMTTAATKGLEKTTTGIARIQPARTVSARMTIVSTTWIISIRCRPKTRPAWQVNGTSHGDSVFLHPG
ncbi:MAG: hypothetical protein QNJ04_03670 [Desulfobacterales bacterium]|nr:hypothetical protein [Desulfobacterales bacterium]